MARSSDLRRLAEAERELAEFAALPHVNPANRAALERGFAVTAPGTELTVAQRLVVFMADSETCRWCRQRMRFEQTQTDHQVQVSRGGTNELHNLSTLCARGTARDCHGRKSRAESATRSAPSMTGLPPEVGRFIMEVVFQRSGVNVGKKDLINMINAFSPWFVLGADGEPPYKMGRQKAAAGSLTEEQLEFFMKRHLSAVMPAPGASCSLKLNYFLH